MHVRSGLRLGKCMKLRITPEIHFIEDESPDSVESPNPNLYSSKAFSAGATALILHESLSIQSRLVGFTC
ncbi:hypothetical protein V6N11_026944 [Hibiscus sabdariffa]|uniref:Uncharacterized protein n=1 Tax=Hibiscus sabdariffa TaxID=183260 RepID=A0ABR2PFI7_9ROSI